MRISEFFFFGEGKREDESIAIFLSSSLSFLFLSFLAISSLFWHFIDRLSFSWNFGCYNFSEKEEIYLQKRNG